MLSFVVSCSIVAACVSRSSSKSATPHAEIDGSIARVTGAGVMRVMFIVIKSPWFYGVQGRTRTYIKRFTVPLHAASPVGLPVQKLYNYSDG